MKQKVITIVGPTASGKSGLAVYIAKKYNGEVISADSRQIYKNLDIGTGKITKKEMLGIPHHLLSLVDSKKQFNVSQYTRLANTAIKDIGSRKKMPIICGGTGLYIDALLLGLQFPEVKPDKNLRAKLEKKTASELFLILKKLDQRRARDIDKNNKVRLVRAIEIAKSLGHVPNLKKKNTDFDVLWIGIRPDDETLKKNISKRLTARMKRGMISEGKKLKKNGLSLRRFDSLGLEYRYLGKFLKKELTKKEMLEKLEKEIWQYARRQITWFKRNKDIVWFKDNSKYSSQKIIGVINKWHLKG